MTLFRVDPLMQQRLIDKPESGLGYQIVRYRRSNHDPLVVFNATTAIPLSELRSRTFTAEDEALISGEAGPFFSHERLDFSDDFSVVFSQFDPRQRGKDTFGLAFSEAAVEPSDLVVPSGIPQAYYRYSAYAKDNRVNSHGHFVPGTYATTYTDMHFVPSGFAAVGRYALPNPASACNLFSIVTLDRPTLMGTATPNFGQAGGGVEVLFGFGAKNLPGTSFRISLG